MAELKNLRAHLAQAHSQLGVDVSQVACGLWAFLRKGLVRCTPDANSTYLAKLPLAVTLEHHYQE